MSTRTAPRTRGTNRKRGKKPAKKLHTAMPTKGALQEALDTAEGNLTQVAHSYDVHRRTVGRWIAKLGLVGVSVTTDERRTTTQMPTAPRTPTIPFAAGGPPPNGEHPVAASAADETEPHEDEDGTADASTQRANEPAVDEGATCTECTHEHAPGTPCEDAECSCGENLPDRLAPPAATPPGNPSDCNPVV